MQAVLEEGECSQEPSAPAARAEPQHFEREKREKKKELTAHCSTHILNIDDKTEKIELEM